MVQEFNVVRCFSCQTFQVEQVKKSTNKWSCKLCTEKQSLKQIFFQGTGKECRVNCQALNMKRHEEAQKCSDEVEDSAEEDIHGVTDEEKIYNPTFQRCENASAQTHNWVQFLDDKTSNDDDDDNDDNGQSSLVVKFRGEHAANNACKRKQTKKRNTATTTVRKSMKIGVSATQYGNENIFEDDQFMNSADYNQSKTWRTNVGSHTQSEEVYHNVRQSTHNTPLCHSTTVNKNNKTAKDDGPVKNNNTKDYGSATKEKIENKRMYSEPTHSSVQSKWSKFLSVEEEELDEEDDDL